MPVKTTPEVAILTAKTTQGIDTALRIQRV